MHVPTPSRGHLGAWVAVALLAVAAPSARAAQAYSESFGTSSAGWTNSGQWGAFGATNGYLRGRFDAIGGPPSPQTGRFIATNAASGGAFVGDYGAAGVEQIGFSILAADALPSDLLLRWYGGDGFAYFHGGLAAFITATGVWHTFVFSLRDKAEGGWVGSSATNFAAARQAVTWLEIAITRNGVTAQHYAVDNVFIDAAPSVAPLNTGVAPPQLVLAPLQTGATYRIQATESLAGGTWTNLDLIVATNRWMEWPVTDPTGSVTRFFRVSQRELTP